MHEARHGRFTVLLALKVLLTWHPMPLSPLAESGSSSAGAVVAACRRVARAGLQRRLYGGFDKIAGDDSSFEEIREMFAEDDPVAGPTLKEQMKGQVDEANRALDRMSHMLSRAARKAQREDDERQRRRAEGFPSSDSPSHSRDDSEGRSSSDEPSSGVGAEDCVEGGVDDYFERIPAPTQSLRELRKGYGQLLGGEMLRQPKNMPRAMQEGKERYSQRLMDLSREMHAGRRQWGKCSALGNPVYDTTDPAVALAGFDELPEDVEYRIHGRVVGRSEYKRHRKALQRARHASSHRSPASAADALVTTATADRFNAPADALGVGAAGGRAEGEGRGEEVSSAWSSTSDLYGFDDWERDLDRLRNFSDPQTMAALQRGERVVRGLGHYDLNDTFALTGRPWWNLSYSSDILDVSQGKEDDNKIEGESDSQQLDRDLFPEFVGGAAASVDSRGSLDGVQQMDGGPLVEKGGQAGAGQDHRGEHACGANTSCDKQGAPSRFAFPRSGSQREGGQGVVPGGQGAERQQSESEEKPTQKTQMEEGALDKFSRHDAEQGRGHSPAGSMPARAVGGLRVPPLALQFLDLEGESRVEAAAAQEQGGKQVQGGGYLALRELRLRRDASVSGAQTAGEAQKSSRDAQQAAQALDQACVRLGLSCQGEPGGVVSDGGAGERERPDRAWSEMPEVSAYARHFRNQLPAEGSAGSIFFGHDGRGGAESLYTATHLSEDMTTSEERVDAEVAHRFHLSEAEGEGQGGLGECRVGSAAGRLASGEAQDGRQGEGRDRKHYLEMDEDEECGRVSRVDGDADRVVERVTGRSGAGEASGGRHKEHGDVTDLFPRCRSVSPSECAAKLELVRTAGHDLARSEVGGTGRSHPDGEIVLAESRRSSETSVADGMVSWREGDGNDLVVVESSVSSRESSLKEFSSSSVLAEDRSAIDTDFASCDSDMRANLTSHALALKAEGRLFRDRRDRGDLAGVVAHVHVHVCMYVLVCILV